jgi:hypothetical protein
MESLFCTLAVKGLSVKPGLPRRAASRLIFHRWIRILSDMQEM